MTKLLFFFFILQNFHWNMILDYVCSFPVIITAARPSIESFIRWRNIWIYDSSLRSLTIESALWVRFKKANLPKFKYSLVKFLANFHPNPGVNIYTISFLIYKNLNIYWGVLKRPRRIEIVEPIKLRSINLVRSMISQNHVKMCMISIRSWQ